MDLWVVAALTGAGYAAKYLSRDKEGLSWQKSAHSNGGSFGLVDGFEDSMQQRNDAAIASTSGFQNDKCDSYNEGIQLSPRALHGYSRGRNLLKTRHNNNQMQHIRPIDSLESCLMAQICKHHSQTPLPSPCLPALRPFVVTDGARVISRPSFETCTAQLRDETVSENDELGFGGIFRLPVRGSQQNHVVQRLSSIREMPNRTQRSLQVPPSEAALFCLGFSVGVLCSNLANNSQVVKLKDDLKQTENLVQDLKEELQMKDSLIVNELLRVDASVDYTKTRSDSHIDVDYYVENFDYRKAPTNSESINQIEAELEAELERLELNMNSYTLQIKSSDDDEDEVDTEPIQGELRADNLGSSDASSSLSCSPNQSVSPWELSLRLNQVIESRLEERIVQLERSLEKSRKRVRQLENNDVSSSSSYAERQVPVPLVMNLSGEALDAYNEAFEELSKLSGAAPVEEDRDGDDTEWLIRQIVEKTRQIPPRNNSISLPFCMLTEQ